MLSHKNYYQCYYNNDPTHIMRNHIDDMWDIHFNFDVMQSRPIKSFKDEMLYACELMYDDLRKYTPTLNVFLSGGTDSECLIRCFHEKKIPINPIIIRHVAAPESEETVIALDICNELNLTPTIFDLDIWKLYNTEILTDIALRYQTFSIGMVELLYVLEKIKEPAIIGDELSIDYTTRDNDILRKDEYNYHKWYFYLNEDFDGVFIKYEYLSGIPTILESFKYTPQCWAAMIKTPEVEDIVFNDRGKASGMSSKNIMMSREFGVKYRTKTNVFSDGPYSTVLHRLSRDVMSKLPASCRIYLEYNKLLEILGNGRI